MNVKNNERNAPANPAITALTDLWRSHGINFNSLPNVVYTFAIAAKLDLSVSIRAWNDEHDSFLTLIGAVDEVLTHNLIDKKFWDKINSNTKSAALKLYVDFFNEWKIIRSSDLVNLVTSSFLTSQRLLPTSRLISEWIGQHIDLNTKDSYLDLGTGIGLLSYYAIFSQINFEVNWTGIENDWNQAGICQMLLSIDQVQDSNGDIYVPNVIREDPLLIGAYNRFKWIVCAPPFGKMRTNTYWELTILAERIGIKLTEKTPQEIAYLVQVLSILDNQGQALIVLPLSFTFLDRYKEIRQYLIDRDWIQAVVSFPERSVYPFSSIKLCVLHINKDKPINKVQSIDLELITAKNKNIFIGTYFLNNPDISQAILSLPLANITKADNRINPEQYHLYQLEGDIVGKTLDTNNHPLSSVVKKFYTGFGLSIKDKSKDTIAYIRVKDLKNDNEGLDINLDEVDAFVDQGTRAKLLPFQCILVAKVGSKLKPTLYNRHEPATCNSNILVLELDTEQIIPEYLVIQLRKAEVKQQAELASSGSVIAHLRQDDILSFRISVPPIDIQRESIKEFYAKRDRHQTDEYAQRFSDYTRRLKHSLAYSIDILQSQFRLLSSAIERHNPDWIDTPANPYARQHIAHRTTIRSLLQQMNGELEHAGETLDIVGEWQNLIQHGVKQTKQDLKQFFSSEIASRSDDCEIIIEGERVEAQIDIRLFKHLFREIVTNALKHGFRDVPVGKRRIIIATSYSKGKTQAIIIIRNNGIAFSSGFTTTKYVNDGGSTNGTGLGGAFINEVIRAHRGMIEITPPEQLELALYPVEITITLPIK